MWRTISVYTCYYRYINTYLWCDRYSLVPRSALSSHGFPRDLNKTSKRISENVRETRHRVNTVHIAILKLSESDISLRSRLSPSGVFVCRSSKLRSPSTLSLWSRLAMQITPVFFFFFLQRLIRRLDWVWIAHCRDHHRLHWHVFLSLFLMLFLCTGRVPGFYNADTGSS